MRLNPELEPRSNHFLGSWTSRTARTFFHPLYTGKTCCWSIFKLMFSPSWKKNRPGTSWWPIHSFAQGKERPITKQQVFQKRIILLIRANWFLAKVTLNWSFTSKSYWTNCSEYGSIFISSFEILPRALEARRLDKRGGLSWNAVHAAAILASVLTVF